jgi:hypothetical protein
LKEKNKQRKVQMSKSYYKSNVRKIATGKTMGKWKAGANRKLRRIVKTSLAHGDLEAVADLGVRDVSNIWSSPADGHSWNDPKIIDEIFGDARHKFYNK